jgi:hypothetical protein
MNDSPNHRAKESDMIFKNIAIITGCGALLAACGGGGGNTPQISDTQSRTSLPGNVPAECRGYEFDVYPNGRAPSALREVEITPPASSGAN